MSGRQIFIVLLISCSLGAESFPNEDTSLGIVGGKAVNITDFPFMARYCRGFFCCGAAIIHERLLISSGSCNYYFEHLVSEGKKTFVIIGTDKLRGEGEAYDVEESYLHSKYFPEKYDYDVVVLKLAKALKFNERVKSIELAAKDFVIPDGAVFDVLGFGFTSAHSINLKFPDQLQKVSVPYVSQGKCKRNHLELTERMFCAGTTWKDSCIFDNGGPLVFENKLLGVLISSGCGEEYYPSIYTFVPSVRDFIDATIESNS